MHRIHGKQTFKLIRFPWKYPAGSFFLFDDVWTFYRNLEQSSLLLRNLICYVLAIENMNEQITKLEASVHRWMWLKIFEKMAEEYCQRKLQRARREVFVFFNRMRRKNCNLVPPSSRNLIFEFYSPIFRFKSPFSKSPSRSFGK